MASRTPSSCSRRAVLTGIAGTLSLTAVSLARSAEPQLGADEGFVIYGLLSPFATRVQFRQLQSSNVFTGQLPSASVASVPVIVKTGFYYLFNFESTISVAHAPFREPSDKKGAFQVQPGAVTYVGDWYIGLQGAKVGTSVDTISRARKDNPWLERYALYVSLVGRDVVRVPWEQVPQT